MKLSSDMASSNNKEFEIFNVVIIGVGPAGMMAAHSFIGTGLNTLVIEKNSVIGGAAFETDVNLQNIDGFPPQSNFGDRTLGSHQLADDLVHKAYQIFQDYGLPPKEDNPHDLYSYAVNEPTLKHVLNNFSERANQSRELTIRTRTHLNRIDIGSQRRWCLSLTHDNNDFTVETDNVIVATGKLSAIWLTDFLQRLELDYDHQSSYAMGFRVEGLADTINPASKGQENRKIMLKEQGCITETFCWCKNGGVMSYDFGNARLLDGEHFYGRPQTNTSFGVISTVKLPDGSSNTLASVSFTNYISALGNGKPLLQRFGDFCACRATTDTDIDNNSVKPSLAEYKLCNLRSYYPSIVVDGFLALVDKINEETPGTIVDDSLIYAPILERIFPEISLTKQLETTRTGLFLVGDCSGKGVGVAPAVTMGLAAADAVISQYVVRHNETQKRDMNTTNIN